MRWSKMWLDWKIWEVLWPPPVGIKYIVISIKSQSVMFSTPSLWGGVYLHTHLTALWLELILGFFTSQIYIADGFSVLSLTCVIIPVTENIAGLGFIRSLAPVSPEQSEFLCCSPQQILEGLALIVLFSIHADSCLAPAHSILFLNQEKCYSDGLVGLLSEKIIIIKKKAWFHHLFLSWWFLHFAYHGQNDDHIWFPIS